jgi:hypothetical protein
MWHQAKDFQIEQCLSRTYSILSRWENRTETDIDCHEQWFEDTFIIKSSTKDIFFKEYDFRSYQYVLVWMQISLKKSSIKRVTDTKCVMFLMNWKYLTITIFKVKIQSMFALINVRDIKNALHQSSFYVILICIWSI